VDDVQAMRWELWNGGHHGDLTKNRISFKDMKKDFFNFVLGLLFGWSGLL